MSNSDIMYIIHLCQRHGFLNDDYIVKSSQFNTTDWQRFQTVWNYVFSDTHAVAKHTNVDDEIYVKYLEFDDKVFEFGISYSEPFSNWIKLLAVKPIDFDQYKVDMN